MSSYNVHTKTAIHNAIDVEDNGQDENVKVEDIDKNDQDEYNDGSDDD